MATLKWYIIHIYQTTYLAPSKLHDTLKLHMQNTNIIHHIFYPLLHPSFIIKIGHIYYKVQFVYLHICMQKKKQIESKS